MLFLGSPAVGVLFGVIFAAIEQRLRQLERETGEDYRGDSFSLDATLLVTGLGWAIGVYQSAESGDEFPFFVYLIGVLAILFYFGFTI